MSFNSPEYPWLAALSEQLRKPELPVLGNIFDPLAGYLQSTAYGQKASLGDIYGTAGLLTPAGLPMQRGILHAGNRYISQKYPQYYRTKGSKGTADIKVETDYFNEIKDMWDSGDYANLSLKEKIPLFFQAKIPGWLKPNEIQQKITMKTPGLRYDPESYSLYVGNINASKNPMNIWHPSSHLRESSRRRGIGSTLYSAREKQLGMPYTKGPLKSAEEAGDFKGYNRTFEGEGFRKAFDKTREPKGRPVKPEISTKNPKDAFSEKELKKYMDMDRAELSSYIWDNWSVLGKDKRLDLINLRDYRFNRQ